MKLWKKIIIVMMSILLMVFVLPAINSNISPTSYIVEAASVKISKTKCTVITGKKYTLKITGTSETVKWSSSDKSIATVNSKGKVTAKKKGKATITAKVGGKKYKCKVTVKDSPKLNKTSLTLRNGKTYSLKITGTSETVKWSSSDKSIATVNSKGKVAAKKKGKVTITAKVDGKKYKCKITVKDALKLNKTKISLKQTEKYTLKVTETNETIKWSSDNKDIATVNSKGKVTAKKEGTAVITAKVEGETLKCKVTVNPLEDAPINSFCYNDDYVYIKCNGYSRVIESSKVSKNVKKKYIGVYKDLKDSTKSNKFYTIDDDEPLYASGYLFTTNDNGYLQITSSVYNDIGEEQKGYCLAFYNPQGKVNYDYNDVKWTISDTSKVRINYSQQNFFNVIPLEPGKATITATYKNAECSFEITIKDSKPKAQYSYKITDISSTNTWYAGYNERLLFIKTKNPDINSFTLLAKGISCGMSGSILSDNITFEDRHISNWGSNSFTDKKNYYRAKDGSGYYVKISTKEIGKVNFYIKEGDNTLTSTKLSLESVDGGEQKYKQWLKNVEKQSINSSMTTLEKIEAVSDWLSENCYYPTCVYDKNGNFFHYEYSEAPIWETPMFDCATAVGILKSIIKDYDGVEKVVWDGGIGSHLAIVTYNGKEYYFNACPYIRVIQDVHLDI